MIAVIGLDLSLLSTGIAEADGSTRVVKVGDRRGMARIDMITTEIRRAVDRATTISHIVHVAIENYAFNAGNKSHQIGELGGVTRYLLYMAGVPYVDVTPSQVKKFATGVGNANKYDVRRAAEVRLGLRCDTDDEADAAWVRAVGCWLLEQPNVALPKSNQLALRGFAPDPWVRRPRVLA